MKRIICPVEYVMGHLRNGHYELVLNDEEFEKFTQMSDEEKERYIDDNGDLEVDDWRIDDVGPLELCNLGIVDVK